MTDFEAPMSPRQRQALLQSRFPDWEVWYVPLALGGFTWCARRRDETNLRNTLTADSASRLAADIEREQADRAEHNKAADAFRPAKVIRMDRPEQ